MSDRAPNGFLYAMMDPPPVMEQEFHDWYDTDHIPERMVLDGFLTGLRFVAIDGYPRYMAFYDLRDREVLNSAAYLTLKNERLSPWSKRVLKQVRAMFRAVGRQIYPGNAVTGGKGNASRIVVWRFRRSGTSASEAEIIKGLQSLYEPHPLTVQARLFDVTEGSTPYYLAIVELHALFAEYADASAFGASAKAIDLHNVYAPYLPPV